MSGNQAKKGSGKPGKSQSNASTPSRPSSDNIATIDDVMQEMKTVSSLFDSHDRLRSDFSNLNSEHTQLRCEHDKLRSEYEKLRSDHMLLYQRVEVIEGKLFDVGNELDKTKQERENLVNENDILKQEVETLKNISDELEMSQRSNYLVISNIRRDNIKTDEEQFIDLCNSKLGMSENITKEDIANVSRIKVNPSENRSNQKDKMIIKFQNEKARNRVFKNKKHLKGSGNVITEFLTRRKNELLKQCYDKIPGTFADRSIWTHHGKILIKKAGERTKTFEIKSATDIDRFLSNHNLESRDTPQDAHVVDEES